MSRKQIANKFDVPLGIIRGNLKPLIDRVYPSRYLNLHFSLNRDNQVLVIGLDQRVNSITHPYLWVCIFKAQAGRLKQDELVFIWFWNHFQDKTDFSIEISHFIPPTLMPLTISTQWDYPNPIFDSFFFYSKCVQNHINTNNSFIISLFSF